MPIKQKILKSQKIRVATCIVSGISDDVVCWCFSCCHVILMTHRDDAVMAWHRVMMSLTVTLCCTTVPLASLGESVVITASSSVSRRQLMKLVLMCPICTRNFNIRE